MVVKNMAVIYKYFEQISYVGKKKKGGQLTIGWGITTSLKQAMRSNEKSYVLFQQVNMNLRCLKDKHTYYSYNILCVKKSNQVKNLPSHQIKTLTVLIIYP